MKLHTDENPTSMKEKIKCEIKDNKISFKLSYAFGNFLESQ